MIREPNRIREFLVNSLFVAIFVLFVVILGFGLVHFLAWLIWILSKARLPSIGMPSWLLDLVTEQNNGKPRHISAERIGGLATAIFTLLLCYITWTVGRASRRQVAGDAPLLSIRLFVPPPTLEGVTKTALPNAPAKRDLREREVYPQDLATADERIFKGDKFRALQPARMVKVQIDNVQQRPFAVARDVAITFELTFNDPDLVPDLVSAIDSNGPHISAPLPAIRKIRRDVQVRILPPNAGVIEPIFNLAALDECEVAVADVSYRELRRKRARKGAYGDLFLTIKGDATVEAKEGYYRPRGWEMP